MPRYTVHLYETVSTAVDVEAEDIDAAIETAYDSEDGPGPITVGAFGRAVVDESQDWQPSAVTDETGAVIWTEPNTTLLLDEYAALRGAVRALLTAWGLDSSGKNAVLVARLRELAAR